MTDPRGDDRDQHSLRVHYGRAGIPRVVQPNLPHLRGPAQFPPEVAECVGVVWAHGIVDHDVLPRSYDARADPQPLSGLDRFGADECLRQRPARLRCARR